MHSAMVRGGKVEVLIGEPIETAGMTLHDRGKLNQMLQDRVAAMVGETLPYFFQDWGKGRNTLDRMPDATPNTIPAPSQNLLARYPDRLALRQPSKSGARKHGIGPNTSCAAEENRRRTQRASASPAATT